MEELKNQIIFVAGCPEDAPGYDVRTIPMAKIREILRDEIDTMGCANNAYDPDYDRWHEAWNAADGSDDDREWLSRFLDSWGEPLVVHNVMLTKEPMQYAVEFTKTGTIIDEFQTREAAEEAIQSYYREDKAKKCFSEGFYSVRDYETDECEVAYSDMQTVFVARDYGFKVPGVSLEDGEIEIIENGHHAFAWPDFYGGTMEIGEWTYMEPVDGKLVMVDESEAPDSIRRAVRRFESGESVAGALFAGMRSAMLA